MASLGVSGGADGVCNTELCLKFAQDIKHDMNLNIDPCTDFYQYSCGGWISDSHIPDSESGVGTFSDMRNDNLDTLGAVLNATYDDLLHKSKDTSSYDPEFVGNEEDIDRENFEALKSYYDSCMNENVIDGLGPTPIFKDILNLTTLFKYSTFMDDEPFDIRKIIHFTDIIKHLAENGVPSIMSVNIEPDERHPEINSISLSQPRLGLPSREYFNQTEILDTYKEGLNNVLNAIYGEETDGTSTNEFRLEKLKENNLPTLNKEVIARMVDRFIAFEKKLADITLPKDELQDPIAMYNPNTLDELDKNYPLIGWNDYFRHFIPDDTAIPDKVIVTTPQYFSRLYVWLSNVDHSLETKSLYEFFFVKATLSKVDMLDSHTRELYRVMYSKIGSGTTAPPLRVRNCIGNTADLFGQMLGRYFVMLKFGGEKQRLNAGNMIDNIRTTWANRLDKIGWLDDVTRQRAIDKVNSINHQEAYSIHTPDDRSPKALKEYYDGIKIDVGNFYENQMSGHSWFFKKEWSRVGQPVDNTRWYMDPQDVNAYYSPTSNQVVVPAGILQPPFYGDGLPEYLNYGGIGVVIGHEITHAFDNSGRLYDGGGHLSQWWTNKTSDAFQEKTKCFVKQYGNFSIEGVNGATYNVNGKLTLGENLADNGGVHAAWTAMKKKMEASPETNLRLPGLENLTPEQLFFVNFGRVWCTNMRPEMAVQRIRSDVHSPAMVRVNAAVQNNIAFKEAFNCDAKKPMNPEEKCLIW